MNAHYDRVIAASDEDVVQTEIELERRLNEPGLEPALASTP